MMDEDEIITQIRSALLKAAPANSNIPVTRVHHSGEILVRLITEAPPSEPRPRRRKPAPLPPHRKTDPMESSQGPTHPLGGDHIEAYIDDVLQCPPSWQRRADPSD